MQKKLGLFACIFFQLISASEHFDGSDCVEISFDDVQTDKAGSINPAPEPDRANLAQYASESVSLPHVSAHADAEQTIEQDGQNVDPSHRLSLTIPSAISQDPIDQPLSDHALHVHISQPAAAIKSPKSIPTPKHTKTAPSTPELKFLHSNSSKNTEKIEKKDKKSTEKKCVPILTAPYSIAKIPVARLLLSTQQKRIHIPKPRAGIKGSKVKLKPARHVQQYKSSHR